jgi:hypothetical protein
VFVVHELPATGAERERAGLLRAALTRTVGGRYPDIVGPRLLELGGGIAPGVGELIASLDARCVLLAGPETWWLPGAVRSAAPDARVVSVPLVGEDPAVGLGGMSALMTEVDAIGVFSGAEGRHVSERRAQPGSDRTPRPEIVELDAAFAVNRSAAESDLVKMTEFERVVVVMTGYPDGTPAARHPPGHDYLRRQLGPVSVAEVAHDRWLISNRRKVVEIPVKPSRPNLWKLLRQAEVCLDLRPQGIVGRETIESLLLGTPVVVPEGTVAAEHAERSNGGLWYGDYRQLFDAAKAILDNATLRERLGSQGREWAEMVHGDHGRFSDQVARLVLG